MMDTSALEKRPEYQGRFSRLKGNGRAISAPRRSGSRSAQPISTSESSKGIAHFFKNVMNVLKYYGWILRMVAKSSEGFCWRDTKTLDVGENAKNCKRLLLHEIAHINTSRFCNNKHNLIFWRRYEDLLRRFLPKTEIEKRYHENIGYYKVCYDTAQPPGSRKGE